MPQTSSLPLSVPKNRTPSLFQNFSIRDGVPSTKIPFQNPAATEKDPTQQRIHENCCLSCAFSIDDVLVAFGMQHGMVFVYDTESSQLLWTLDDDRGNAVRELAFVKGQNLLVSVDEERRCAVWELRDEPLCVYVTDFASRRLISHILLSEMPCLSQNGRFLALPVLPDSAASSSSSASWRIPTNIRELMVPRAKRSMHVKIYSTLKNDKKSDSKHPDPFLTLSVRMDVGNAMMENMDIVQFSPSASRILLLACEGESLYLILWPSIDNEDISFKLQGNRGAFSSDERHLATWFDPCPSAEPTCLVWDMKHLESVDLPSQSQGWQHPRFRAFDPVDLRDERFTNILACGFVSVHSESSIAVCYATERIQIVIWSLSIPSPICIIQTSFDVTVDAISFSVSSDQHWICLNSPKTGDVTVWSADQGTEVFHAHGRDPGMPDHFWSDVLISHTSRYMLCTEKHQANLLNMTPLHSMCPSSHIVLTGSEKETIERQPIFKFSFDGRFIGLLMAPGNCLDVWALQNGRHLKLDWKGIVQAHRMRSKGKCTSTSEARFTFHQFALSRDGEYAASCMGDNSVLLWQLKSSPRCLFVAELPSDCFLPRGICFSHDPSGKWRLVVCQDQGDLVWVDPDQTQIVKTLPAEGSRLCRFSADGTKAVMMSDLFTVHIWDLVHQTELQRMTYQIPLLSPHSSLAEQNIFLDGRFLAGFDKSMKPIVYEHHLADGMRMSDVTGVAVGVSDDGEWGVMVPTVSHDAEPPSVNRRSSFSCQRRGHTFTAQNIGVHAKKSHTSTLNLIHLTGCGLFQSVHLPDSLSAESPVLLSPDGKYCAALDTSQQLVVWNAHMTEGNFVQECICLRHDIHTKQSPPPHLTDLLHTHRGALLNSHDENGMTVVMQSVYDQNSEILKGLLTWALAEGCKVTLEGPIRLPEENITAKNAVDLSFHIHHPDITKMLLDFMVDGVTTEMSMAQIFEESLMDVASVYPSLFAEIIENPKFIRPLCTVHIPGKWVSDTKHMALATHNDLLPSAETTNQIWKSKETKKINCHVGKLCGHISAEASVIPIPHLAQISTGSVLHRLNTTHLHDSVYGSDFVRALVEFKLHAYGRKILQREFYVYFVLLASFTWMGMILVFCGVEHRTSFTYFLAALSSFISAGYVLYYCRTVYDALATHGLQGLTLLRRVHISCMTHKCFVSYCLVAFVIPVCLIWYPKSPFLGTSIGVSSFILWMRLGQFLETSEAVGPLLVTVEEVIDDISWFLTSLLQLVIGCGISLFFIVNISPEPFEKKNEMVEFDSKNPIYSVLVAIMLMLSDIGNIFEAFLNAETGFRLYIILGLLIFYVDLVAIILLNVMIAMMGDSFDRVKNSEGSLFTKRKAQILHSLEMRLSQKEKHEINTCMGRYLHIARLKDVAMAPVAPWRGRLNAIRENNRQEN